MEKGKYQYYIGPEGPKGASLAIVAEQPGPDELDNLIQTGIGRPLIGTTGRAVDRHLLNIGTARSEVYLTNAQRHFNAWRGPDGRWVIPTPSREALVEQQVELLRELSNLPNLNCVIAMGAKALASLSNFHMDEIGNWRGSILQTCFGKKMVPTYHPSFYFHGEWRYRTIVEFDLARALEESRTPDLVLPARDFYLEPTYNELCDWHAELMAAPVCSYDIELFRGGHVSCIAFSDRPDRAFCYPIMRGNRQPYWPVHEEASVWRKIDALLNRQGVMYVSQNGPFDSWHLWRHGVRTTPGLNHVDLMHMHRVLAPDLPHALQFTVSIYTREPYYKDESGDWRSEIRVPDRQFWTYNCKDAACTLEAAYAMIEDMREL